MQYKNPQYFSHNFTVPTLIGPNMLFKRKMPTAKRRILEICYEKHCLFYNSYHIEVCSFEWNGQNVL